MIILIQAIADSETLSRNLGSVTAPCNDPDDLGEALRVLQRECDRFAHWVVSEASAPPRITVRITPLAPSPGDVEDRHCHLASLTRLLDDSAVDQRCEPQRARGEIGPRHFIERAFETLLQRHSRASRTARQLAMDTSDETFLASEEFRRWLDNTVRESRSHVDLTGVLGTEQTGRFDVVVDDVPEFT